MGLLDNLIRSLVPQTFNTSDLAAAATGLSPEQESQLQQEMEQRRLFGPDGRPGGGDDYFSRARTQERREGRGVNTDPYLQQTSPEDYQNINPYTDQFYQQMQGDMGDIYNSLMESMAQGPAQVGANAYVPQMQEVLGNIDPTAANNYFMNNSAQAMRGVAAGNFDPFASQQQAQRQSQQAVQNIASQFADRGPGALRSGAAQAAMMEGAINPLIQQNVRMAELVGGQAGQLQGQNMSQLFNAFNTANQQRLQGTGQLMDDTTQRDIFDAQSQQTQRDLLARIYGQQAGLAGSLAGPEFTAGTFLNNPEYQGPGHGLQQILEAAGAGADIAALLAQAGVFS